MASKLPVTPLPTIVRVASPMVVLYDLDSTLFNVEHRANLAPEDKVNVDNWIPYSKACINDTPIEGVARTLQIFWTMGFRIHLVSGRNVEAYDETVEVMAAYDLPWDEIRLHKPDDLRHNGEFKSKYINELKENGLIPVLMFEDHREVCEMITERTEVPCVNVAVPYKDTVGVSFNLQQAAK